MPADLWLAGRSLGQTCLIELLVTYVVKVWSRCGSSWNYWCCDYSHCPCAFLGPDYFVLPRYDIMYIYTLSCSVFTKKSTVSSLYCGVPAGYG